MVRVVTQETYNDVVKENMEEFDMTPEEAVKEAVAQFEAQGVDLSNIIKNLILGEDDLSLTINTLKELSEQCSDDEAILIHLETLAKACSKDLAHRLKASNEGAYEVLLTILEKKVKIDSENVGRRNTLLLVELLNTLVVFMDTQPDLLDVRGLDLICNILDKVDNNDILAATVRWASICCVRHEKNRQQLFARNIGEKIKVLLTKKHNKLLSELLLLLRRMTLDDDVRVEFGNAHEHARQIGVITLNTLTMLLREHTKPPLVSELMLTIAALLVRHDLCKMVSDAGIEVVIGMLTDNFDNSAVIQQAHRLITALAGHDEVKRELVKSGIVPLVIQLLTKHANNAATAGAILKSIGALTLREPGHSKQFLENGVADAIIECMKAHPMDANVQKMSCIAIRNLVARCRDYNTKFQELGAEDILKEALERFTEQFGYEIRAALRDLDCEVKLQEQWTGKGVSLENE